MLMTDKPDGKRWGWRNLSAAIVVVAIMAAGWIASKVSWIRSPRDPDVSFGEFKAPIGGWAIEVNGPPLQQRDELRVAIEEVDGVESGSVVVSPKHNYVAFMTTASPRTDRQRYIDFHYKVLRRLVAFGLQIGSTKGHF
jgi:hypothetical protein